MFDVSALRILLLVVTGGLERRERHTIADLIAENRLSAGNWVAGAFA